MKNKLGSEKQKCKTSFTSSMSSILALNLPIQAGACNKPITCYIIMHTYTPFATHKTIIWSDDD